MAHLHVVDGTPTSWDRGPDPAKAKRLRQLRRRRDTIWNRARRLLHRGPPGNYRTRFCLLGELYLEVQCLYAEIELLELR